MAIAQGTGMSILTSESRNFYIDNLLLTVFNGSYLVEVSRISDPPRQDNIHDLPSWAFSSRNAIWFLQEDQPYKYRAEDGERIKAELLGKF